MRVEKTNYLLYILIDVFVILLVNFLHNYALLQTPFFEDEFVYCARAWSFMKFGALEVPPDLFNFDDPPLGWMIMGLFYYLLPNVNSDSSGADFYFGFIFY